MTIYCVKIPHGSVEQADTDAWLADNVLGWVMGMVARWSDVTKSYHNQGSGVWNMLGGKFTYGARHPGSPWADEPMGEKDYMRWDFEKQGEAREFKAAFGGEAFTR